MRTQVPVIIAFTIGTLMLVQFFVPHHISESFEETVTLWARIIGAFALVVGIGSLVQVQVERLRRRSEGWVYSVVALLSLALMALAGIIQGQDGPLFQWLFLNVQVPLGATVFSLLAFFIASAAYRAFRARSPEAALLLVAAVVVMLGRVPLGVELSRWFLHVTHVQDFLATVGISPDSDLSSATEWILRVPNLAMKRAIMFGAAIAAVAQSLRIILGIERPYMSGT